MNTPTGRLWSVFYTYTALSVVGIVVMMPLAIAAYSEMSAPLTSQPLLSLLLAVQIAIGAWSAWRSLRGWSTADAPVGRDLWDLPRAGRLPSDVTLLITVVLSVVVATLTPVTGADISYLVVSLSLLAATALVRWTWPLGAAASVALGVLAVVLGASLPTAVTTTTLVLLAVVTSRLSLWLAAMVRELDVAREAQAQLAVAEERLRFARDLHDVTGRDLSVIAVKSELVAQLAERQDPRAVEHGREVAQIARTSLAEIRTLVRGYREADLATELRGTVSLLRSAHVDVQVEGTAEEVPALHAGRAAWVLREGGTNILRHADPRTVALHLSRDGITLVNDGVAPGTATIEGAGLTGMRERLGERAVLTTHLDEDRFTLDVRFDSPEGL